RGRTLEVHGPCLVSDLDAGDCDPAGLVPVTTYAYYGATGDANAGRLASRTQYVNTSPGITCDSDAGLTTAYTYDTYGNVVSVTDPNGVVTTSTYSRNRLKTSTTSGLTTTYNYDDAFQQPSSVQFPQGNYE